MKIKDLMTKLKHYPKEAELEIPGMPAPAMFWENGCYTLKNFGSKEVECEECGDTGIIEPEWGDPILDVPHPCLCSLDPHATRDTDLGPRYKPRGQEIK